MGHGLTATFPRCFNVFMWYLTCEWFNPTTMNKLIFEEGWQSFQRWLPKRGPGIRSSSLTCNLLELQNLLHQEHLAEIPSTMLLQAHWSLVLSTPVLGMLRKDNFHMCFLVDQLPKACSCHLCFCLTDWTRLFLFHTWLTDTKCHTTYKPTRNAWSQACPRPPEHFNTHLRWFT